MKSMQGNYRSSSSFSIAGDEREMESGLIFNQLICEFESRHPCQLSGRMLNVTTSQNCPVTLDYLSPFCVGRSSIGRAPHCDCGR